MFSGVFGSAGWRILTHHKVELDGTAQQVLQGQTGCVSTLEFSKSSQFDWRVIHITNLLSIIMAARCVLAAQHFASCLPHCASWPHLQSLLLCVGFSFVHGEGLK